MKRQGEENRRNFYHKVCSILSEIFLSFIHSEFARRLNYLDDNRVLLKATRFETESYYSAACFKGV
jgi:hypothetical protein